MQKNTVIIVAIITLLVGLGAGYKVGISATSLQMGQKDQVGHVMPDGSMMGGSGNMDMAEMMEVMNAELRGKTGDAFDKAFLAEMIVHHEGAVEMAQLALSNAKHQEVKNLATKIIDAQNKEIAEMKSWQKMWFNQ